MDFETIQQNLAQGTNVEQSLDELGTLLREESWRSRNDMKPLVLHVLGLIQHDLSSLEALRVLVNFTADNDENRNFLISQEAFGTWIETSLAGSPDVAARTVLLMSQYIHNVSEEDTPRFTSFLVRFLHQLVAFVVAREDVEDAALALEILADFSEETLQELDEKEASDLWGKASSAFVEDADGELLLYASLVLYKMTLSDKLCRAFVPHSILEHFSQVPESDDAVRTKRYLFAGFGNIVSSARYDNWADVNKSIEWVVNSENDPYAVAAAAIDIGNCVRSAEDQEKVVELISEKAGLEVFITTLLSRPFGDLVQYQFVHCLTNILQPKSCEILLNKDNEPQLRRISKVVLDNAQFYPEIAKLVTKFFTKLFRIEFVVGSRDVVQYGPLALPLLEGGAETDEVALVLLQAKQSFELLQDREFGPKLLEALFRVRQHVNAVVLLEQLKAQGVFFHTHAAKLADVWDKDELLKKIAEPFAGFLSSVASAASEGTGAYEVVENNTRFVAATALTFFRERGEEFESTAKLCEDVLRKQEK